MISSALSLDPLMREAAGSDPLTTWTPLALEGNDGYSGPVFLHQSKGNFLNRKPMWLLCIMTEAIPQGTPHETNNRLTLPAFQ